jgi:GNAT superfamily N-acetyltransferase
MGILPEYRGQGYGRWIHRHGLRMLKDQGGKVYQGGTLARNEPMTKLFLQQGCEKFRAMQIWKLTL